ncbi:Zn-dependent alcohol dehydrogenase [Actinosynnema sp. NPDC047251]|uniref:Alcohol dehydrogenase, GroES domain protein n=1 Tax=Saccharothrix espanaensis (strain ATCC 51144 / DSM 44229 / JCM 9112 / NBRC 15066 / NRRL 15764) TaxID=1179773 RepID=K0K2I2_SACES|nr:Zn-dependent alcohol dehydrogenase [Saccharothrix espanaensis]CCH32526.1 Alcohol dehydrogenase, GroES domain protein [Saccharothrix espanaensis DSM 44229]
MIPTGTPYRRLDHDDGRVVLGEARVAEPSGTSAKAVIAPRRVGVCRSDLRELRSDRHLRRDFGHEIVAEVVGGTDGLGLVAGQRVVFDPHPPLHARTSGYGELVELEGAPEAVRGALVPVPDTVPEDRAVFAEPLACACHCVRRLEDAGGDRRSAVAVVGAGMAGTLIAAVLHADGVPVSLVNRGAARLDFLRAHHVLPEDVLAPAAGRRFDRVVLATASASPEALDAALAMVRPGGVLLLFAGTRPGVELAGVDLDDLRRRERVERSSVAGVPLVLAGTHGALRADFDRALGLLAATGPGWTAGAAVERLTTRRMSLAEAASALPDHAENGFVGKPVVVLPHRGATP